MNDDPQARTHPHTGSRSRALDGGIGLGSLAGVQIRVDWSLLIIFALVTVSLGSALFPAWHPAWSPVTTWATALGAAVLFFASVLAHEMSHALVARAHGIPVRRITLFLFGGMAHLESEPPSPKSEFLMAAIGPVVSIAIGFFAWLAGSLLAAPVLSTDSFERPAEAMAQVGPIATLLLWLGPVNIFLGVFNLVPGFPLDGGRVLRSFLWWTTGDLVRATRWSAAAGQVFAWALMAVGIWLLLVGGLAQGLWLLLIGWFLNNAARASYERLVMHRALEDVPVRRVMVTRFERVPPELTARQFADDHLMRSEQRAFPVEKDGRFLGIVGFDEIRRVPPENWNERTVGELMVPAEELAWLPPEAEAERALDQLLQRDVDRIPVLHDGQLLGLVERRDLDKFLVLRARHRIGA